MDLGRLPSDTWIETLGTASRELAAAVGRNRPLAAHKRAPPPWRGCESFPASADGDQTSGPQPNTSTVLNRSLSVTMPTGLPSISTIARSAAQGIANQQLIVAHVIEITGIEQCNARFERRMDGGCGLPKGL